ncbi:hypothetical protein K503DRAFT_131978 [Rhizopogon vinicolor AM-OR11-026]|uniref:Uncharacterized protein n=1 Tax=Rhizopogon vinicolor AM-OR11-026 TaxID=1314800 RepID=A0A1B7MEK4_9AGAM|nr:hypothetical protein K503DRAFT_131978 [Rhizopogon vinicolor AM-OR11-026]
MTPSLLVAVLESILESCLPIPASIRASRSSLAKVEAMKVFLGVLECDVLPTDEDIGLANIDARILAKGGWEETVLVGELLCWLRRKRGIIDALVCDDNEGEVDLTASILPHPELSYVELWHITDVLHHPHVPSPSTRFTATTSAQIHLSMHDAPPVESDTSIAYSELSDWTETQPIRGNTIHHQPQCIHGLEDPSYFLERNAWYTSFDDHTKDTALSKSRPFSSRTRTSSIGGRTSDERITRVCIGLSPEGGKRL